ncbi:MAG: hypothetical protein A2Z21_01455 [Candidatus Fraserbacteria bacterium RBG_16_55_9]|uniref:Uncharacterized protein n=1 Tax=Fraserbacteria sp. (strain RBG_16_55_9) TaxID=1817864 RepID=A0A1F5URH0_FRAXR|nr:MAG: hypothetical protein A2Z21_01455 [Candidatus Fraserbacteria bacterium RBG_16_55_9]
MNLINNHDGGRLAGISVYDGADTYNNANINDPINWGWNPTPSDKYNHTNRPLEYSLQGDTFYVKARNLHWNPDNKGGGRIGPIASDLIVEMWLTFLPSYPTVLQVRFRATHDGEDAHEMGGQEFPFTYVNRGFDRVVTYSGSQPWTGAAPTVVPNLPTSSVFFSANEGWISLVNAADKGLTFFAPYHYPLIVASAPDATAPHEDDTNYIVPLLFQSYSPGISYKTTVYYIVDRWQGAREIIQELRHTLPAGDIALPFGMLDEPQAGATVGQVVAVVGWALDNVAVDRVEVFLDGNLLGTAQYGLGRPDVANAYPGLPGSPNFGFAFQFATEQYTRGPHEIRVRLTDRAGNTQMLPPRRVSFGNAPAFGTLDVADAKEIAGWAHDPDLGEDPVQVIINIDGKDVATIVADQNRPDLAGDPRIRGTRHGFTLTTPSLAKGSHTVHTYVIDVPTGSRIELSGSPKTVVSN